MALWDNADLLARCKFIAQRPSTDQQMADADWYSLMTESQAHWTNVFATQFPYVLVTAPTALSTADGGLTYTFPGGITPMAVEVYDSASGRILRPGAYWDAACDYVWEGTHIRFPVNKSRTYSSGPVARYISPSSTIDASTQPTLLPAHARLLIVYRAVAYWAERGGLRDPQPFWEMEQRYWIGNPASGDFGLLGMLKNQNPFIGAAAYPAGSGLAWWQTISTGQGYTPYVA